MTGQGKREDMEAGAAALGAAGGHHIIVTALVVRDDQVLLCHRSPARRWYPDVWDFAGGHVEAGESPAGALVRELREELGITITEPAGPELARFVAATYDMRVWLVQDWSGDPANTAPAEHDRIGWFTASELAGLRLADDRYVSLITRVLAGQREPSDDERLPDAHQAGQPDGSMLQQIMADVEELIARHAWETTPRRRMSFVLGEALELADEVLQLPASGPYDAALLQRLGSEIYDVLWNVCDLARLTGIDVVQAAKDKRDVNAKRVWPHEGSEPA